ncbi:MAG: tetratricopeptide repeat protein [Deltaproteobacteria bacterium]|nr:tetratricopeptide repeat protein [Deltaproteobacteria bacterium]
MRIKREIIPVLFALMFLTCFLPRCSNDVSKAQEFMDAGMYPQAIELLNKRTSERPYDAEAHFKLGVCYINTGNYSGANERFISAVRLDSDYGFQIGGVYKNAGYAAFDEGRVSLAQNLFQAAVEYQPSLKDGIIEECFQKGESTFGLILGLDPDQKSRIADYYKSASDKAENEEEKVGYLKKAARMDHDRYGDDDQKKSQSLGN